MKRTAFLYAYKAKNLGDDLFVHAITGRYPGVQFYTWADGAEPSAFSAIPNLKELNPDSALIRWLGRIRPSFAARYKTWLEKRCDAVVYIGGSIFIEYENWPDILNWWEYAAQKYSFYVLGANFGPYKSEAYRARLESIFGKMQDVCFRDRYSLEKFSGCAKVRCAPDILFAYPMPKPQVREKQVFFSVIHCGKKDEGGSALGACRESYTASMARLIRGYLEDGFTCVLSSFCKAEGDEDAIREILEAAQLDPADERIRILCYDGTNAQELLHAIAESGEVIASRFHAAILALAAGRPVFPVVYSDKTIRVLEDMRFRGGLADIREKHFPCYGEIRKMISESVAECGENAACEAEKHFLTLDSCLKREKGKGK